MPGYGGGGNITFALIMQAQTGGAKAVQQAMANVEKATKQAESAAKSLTTSQKQLTTSQQNLTKVNDAAVTAAKKLNDANIAVQASYLKVENAADQARAMLQNYADVENEAGVTTERLDAAAQLAADALAKVAAADKDVEAAMSAANDAADQEAAAMDAVSAASQKVADAQAQVATATKDASDAANLAKTSMEDMSTAGEYLNGVLESIEGTIEAFLPLLALQGVQALFSFGQSAVQMAGDYEQVMNMVQALTGSTTAQMQQYSEQLSNLSIQTGADATQLANGLYYIISAGYKGGDAMKMLELSTKDAVIGMTDAKTTANALTTVMQGFSIPISQANAVNGEMLKTVTLGKMQMSDYASAISKVAAVASQYHVSLEAVNASLATLTEHGVKNANVAGTDTIHLIQALMGNTNKLTQNMHNLGYSGFNQTAFDAMTYQDRIQYLNKFLGKHSELISQVIGKSINASQAYVKLSQGAKDFGSNLDKLKNQTDNAKKTQDAWNITQQGYAVQAKKAGAAMNELGKTIGTALLPYLTKFLKMITPIMEQFAQWLTSSKSLEKGLAASFHAIYAGFKTMTDEIQLGLDIFTGNWQDAMFEINDITGGNWRNILDGMQTFINSLISNGNVIFDAMIAPYVQAYNAIAGLLHLPQASMPTFGFVSFTTSGSSVTSGKAPKMIFGTKQKSGGGSSGPSEHYGTGGAPSDASPIGGGGVGTGTTSKAKAKSKAATTSSKLTIAEIAQVVKDASAEGFKISASLLSHMSATQQYAYLQKEANAHHVKVETLLKGLPKDMVQYIEYALSQHQAKTKTATTHAAKTSKHALSIAGATGTVSGTAAAASQGSSGFTVINNIGSINITSTINASGADAKQVYNMFMKQFDKDIKRSGLFSSMTSGGISSKK